MSLELSFPTPVPKQPPFPGPEYGVTTGIEAIELLGKVSSRFLHNQVKFIEEWSSGSTSGSLDGDPSSVITLPLPRVTLFPPDISTMSGDFVMLKNPRALPNARG